MNILIFSSPNPYNKAGILAFDLYKGLSSNSNIDVKLIVKDWFNNNEKNIVIIDRFYTKIIIKIQNKISKIFKNYKGKKNNSDYQILDFDETKLYFSTKKLLRKSKIKPDIIIILFMQHMISYKNVFEFNKKTGAKVFLYPMDMAPFTGGCHYSWDCNGYTKLCGNCPALNSNNLYDQTYKNLKFKSFYIQQSNISLFAGNSQLTYQIRNSAIFKNKKIYEDIYPIPDENIFYDRNKIDARKYFNLNFNDKILFFGCNSLFDKRKGISILIEALNNSLELIKKNNNIFLLIAGNGYEEIKNLLPFKNKYIGHISDFNELALAYSASDFYISPSVEDAGPTMVLQSILCNTPIISFDIGFAKDLIEDRKNGFKAERKNAESLAKSLKSAFDISQTEYEEIKLNLNLTEKRIKETSFSDKIYKIISES